jgi:hypothetical protein
MQQALAKPKVKAPFGLLVAIVIAKSYSLSLP